MSNIIVKNKKYLNDDSLENVIYYMLRINEKESNNSCIATTSAWGGMGVNNLSPSSAIHSFQVVKKIYNKRDGNQLHHMILTIYKRYSNLELKQLQMNNNKIWARLISDDVSKLIFDMGFQNIYALHNDTNVLHIHFAINSINWIYGNRMQSTRYFYNKILSFLRLEYYMLNWEGVLYHD